MNILFIRANGESVHNEPGSPGFVPGEPPTFPEKKFNYRHKCLAQGFARIGWPNTGDLRQLGYGSLAAGPYTHTNLRDSVREWHSQFLAIRTGDIVLIPAAEERGKVHLGRVVLRDRRTRNILSIRPGLPAYYYFHDIPRGEWYECAHRVDVLWDRDESGHACVHEFEALGGIWRQPFSRVLEAREGIVGATRSVGLSAGSE